MVQIAFKKLDDIKNLQIGKELPISEYVDPDRGFLELKGFGDIYKNGRTTFDGSIYDVALIIKDIEIYKQRSACIYVDVINKKQKKPTIGSGALICILEE